MTIECRVEKGKGGTDTIVVSTRAITGRITLVGAPLGPLSDGQIVMVNLTKLALKPQKRK